MANSPEYCAFYEEVETLQKRIIELTFNHGLKDRSELRVMADKFNRLQQTTINLCNVLSAQSEQLIP